MEAAAAQGFSAVAFGEAGAFKWNYFSHKDIDLGNLHGSGVTAAHSYATLCILFAKSRPEVAGGSGFPSVR